jgi:hypothetical protein
VSPALPRPPSPTLAFIENDNDGGLSGTPGTALLGQALAAGGAALVHLFRALQEQAASRHPTEATILERPRACGIVESARAYLDNLQRDGMDQALRSIPARTYDWKLPTGHGVESWRPTKLATQPCCAAQRCFFADWMIVGYRKPVTLSVELD